MHGVNRVASLLSRALLPGMTHLKTGKVARYSVALLLLAALPLDPSLYLALRSRRWLRIAK